MKVTDKKDVNDAIYHDKSTRNNIILYISSLDKLEAVKILEWIFYVIRELD